MHISVSNLIKHRATFNQMSSFRAGMFCVEIFIAGFAKKIRDAILQSLVYT